MDCGWVCGWMGRKMLEILELLAGGGIRLSAKQRTMTQTEKMVREMNGFFKQIGDA